MLWLHWRQHRADRAESRSIQRYLAHRREQLAQMAHDVVAPGDPWGRGNTVNGTGRDCAGV